MSPAGRFDRFVAIDWSGARVARGIALAEAVPGNGAPRLVKPADKHWSRGEVLDYLAGLVTAERVLIGIDCAFSLPWERAGHYGLPDAPALWARIDALGGESDDLSGHGFVSHLDYANDYWRSGPRPEGYLEPHRATEMACRADGLGAPESPYKLIGAKQVGMGGLAGMRLLHRLRVRSGSRLGVWPFDGTDAPSLAVEIYPRLFLRRFGHGGAKVRSPQQLAAVLAAMGAGVPESLPEALDDNDADALVSAVGLRWLSGIKGVWQPPALDDLARRCEGWIFGVGLTASTGG
ncbi:hypothetical protein [Radicibacter daui]|uniref:hypothetical protein n=1 Tax=Radicibacter daui TaxID=3064829 RepID=UPI004046F006